MSNRRRPRRGQRPAGRRAGRSAGQPPVRIPRPRTPGIPPRRPVSRTSGAAAYVAVALAVVAELGHLVAGYAEWPAATARGVYHVLAGALLGLVAAGLLLATRPAARAGSRVAGAVVALLGPVLWLAGAQWAASPYAVTPVAVAAGVTAAELALAALLFLPTRS